MSIQHIITKALIDYDSVKPVIRYLNKYTHLEGVKTEVDTERSTFKFIDKQTEKVVLDTEVELLAVFYDKLNVWSWAWSHIGLTNAENYLSKEILIYALKLGSDLSYLKSILTTSRGVIKDRTQIDINLAIGSSIIKQPYIYPYIYEIENYHLVYYFVLLNRDQLQKLDTEINESTIEINEEDDFQ